MHNCTPLDQRIDFAYGNNAGKVRKQNGKRRTQDGQRLQKPSTRQITHYLITADRTC